MRNNLLLKLFCDSLCYTYYNVMVVSKDTIVFKLFVLWCKTNFHLKGKLYTAQIDEPFRTRNTTGFFSDIN